MLRGHRAICNLACHTVTSSTAHCSIILGVHAHNIPTDRVEIVLVRRLSIEGNQLWQPFLGLSCLIVGYNTLGYALLRFKTPKLLPLTPSPRRHSHILGPEVAVIWMNTVSAQYSGRR